MLSIAVKNALLIILIILIFHFLIKNYLLDNTKAHFTQQEAQESKTQVPLQYLDAPSCASQSPIPEALPMPTESLKVDKEAELFKFVFEDPPATCSPPLESSYQPEAGSIKKPKTATGETPVTHDQMFINEYDNESVLNGGSLFGGLSGFDSMAGNYSSL